MASSLSTFRSQPSACEIQTRFHRHETSAEAVVEEALGRIADLEPSLHAWKFLDPQLALANARAVDRRRAEGGVVGALAAVPLAVKDIFDTEDQPTAYGSSLYEGHRPVRDAAVVAAAKGAGAVVMGKTVTTEFAYFTPGPTANPWNPAHTPGGSSSGSAAAVAAGMVPLALGSQTAGSLIRPASYCGVFALKPSHGVWPTTGVKPFSESLDTVGWLANSADDLELMRSALAGVAFEPLAALERPRIVRCETHEVAHLDASGEAVWATAQRLLSNGADVKELVLPNELRGLLDAQKTIMAYEAARSLAVETREQAERVSAHVHQLVGIGLRTTHEDYQAALALAARGRQSIAALMEGADAILAPSAPGEAPAGLAATGDPVFSRVWTLLGWPCVNVPGLLGPQGLPVGLQLIGRIGEERRLLAAAAAVHRIFARA